MRRNSSLSRQKTPILSHLSCTPFHASQSLLLPSLISSLRHLDDVALGGVVAQQFLDQIHVREHHAAAAVAVQAEFVHRVAGEGQKTVEEG